MLCALRMIRCARLGPRRLEPAITEHRVEFFVLIFPHKILTTMTSCDLADFGDLVLDTPTKPVAMGYPGSRYGDLPSLTAIIQESSRQSLSLARFWPCSSLQLSFFLFFLKRICARAVPNTSAPGNYVDAESLWSMAVSTDLSTVENR